MLGDDIQFLCNFVPKFTANYDYDHLSAETNFTMSLVWPAYHGRCFSSWSIVRFVPFIILSSSFIWRASDDQRHVFYLNKLRCVKAQGSGRVTQAVNCYYHVVMFSLNLCKECLTAVIS